MSSIFFFRFQLFLSSQGLVLQKIERFQQYQYINLFYQMGNETTHHSRYKNNRSHSLDSLPQEGKILPSYYSKIKEIDRSFQTKDGRGILESEIEIVQKQKQKKRYKEEGQKLIHRSYENNERFEDRQNRLKKLTSKNDELRKELIKISTELTMKLKKKKFEVKQKAGTDEGNTKLKQSLKKQLLNAYKQINMYKKTIQQMRLGDPSEVSDLKITGLQNKIAQKDIQIELCLDELQAVKTVANNQNVVIRKDESNKGALNELKQEIEMLRSKIRAINKEEREREKKYMEQHNYMMALQYKGRQLNGQYTPNINKREDGEKDKLSEKEYEQVKEELYSFRTKHDQYHKKINNLINLNKNMKEETNEQRNHLSDKTKELENIKYKRDAFVKKIKDNLEAFVHRNQEQEYQEQQLSQFQSSSDVVQEGEQDKGTFDIEHLKSQSKIKVNVPSRNKQNFEDTQSKQQPKKWKKMITRVVSKGSQMSDEKQFKSGIKNPKRDMRIIMMNVWMNKKKQITAIQPVYLMDNIVTEGKKSSKNHEDEYRVTYECEQYDYLKSIIGIFSKSGFLQYLVLQSNYGKVSKIGRQRSQGTNFAIGVAKQETPIQIVGASSLDGLYWRINRLQVQVLVDLSSSK